MIYFLLLVKHCFIRIGGGHTLFSLDSLIVLLFQHFNWNDLNYHCSNKFVTNTLHKLDKIKGKLIFEEYIQ